jgi:hypothetical protein
MLRRVGAAACAGILAVSPAFAAPQSIPNFATDSRTGWVKTPGSDEFIQPESGPGPVQDDPKHPYVSNGHPGDGGDPNGQETVKIADITNPILQPWAAEQMRKANEAVLAGKIGFTARARCWPAGVPGFLTYPVTPLYFIQSPKEVVITWGQDFQLRHVYLNVPHSPDPRPSWFGESVGHYENGDTLVIDTIGLDDRTHVDLFRTPHTSALHVVERWRLINGGREIELQVYVEDEGAFKAPYVVTKHYARTDARWIEAICAENPIGPLDQGLEAMPQAQRPDF